MEILPLAESVTVGVAGGPNSCTLLLGVLVMGRVVGGWVTAD